MNDKDNGNINNRRAPDRRSRLGEMGGAPRNPAYIHIYIYIYIYTHTYIYIYIYIEREI